MEPSDNPFFGLPMFGEMAKAMSGQGPLNWDAARQFAAVATGSMGGEPNPDPLQRIRLQELGRIVEMHVHDLTGLDTVFPELQPVSPGTWAQRTLDAYRPLFTELATSLSTTSGTDDIEVADPMMAMIANLGRMMAPAMLGMAVGSRQAGVDEKRVAVLHQCVADEAQPRLLAGALAIKPRVRIGRRGVRVVPALLAMKIRFPIARRAAASGRRALLNPARTQAAMARFLVPIK